jgi:hypothetical protein
LSRDREEEEVRAEREAEEELAAAEEVTIVALDPGAPMPLSPQP